MERTRSRTDTPVSLRSRVSIKGNAGCVRFVGPTEFSTGIWIGVELDDPQGKNDGSVDGVRYFECEKSGNYGMFVRPTLIDRIDEYGNTILASNSNSRPHSQLDNRVFEDNSRQLRSTSSRQSRRSITPRLLGSPPSILDKEESTTTPTNRLSWTTNNDIIPSTRIRSRISSRLGDYSVKEKHDVGSASVDSSPNKSVNTESRLQSIITRLQDKLKKTTGDIDRLNSELIQLSNENSTLKETTTSLEGDLEGVMLDKSILEEKNNTLNQSLDLLQRQYNEMKAEMSELEEEVNLNRDLESEMLANDDLDTLKKRNKKLELGILRSQEFGAVKDEALKKETARADSLNSKYEELVENYNDIKDKLFQADEIIRSLRDSLETSAEFEKIIDSLTEKNNSLNEQVVALTATVQELEQLQELDKDLEETHLGIENELKNDIRSLESALRLDRGTIQELEKKNKYMENQLLKFNNKYEEQISIEKNESGLNERITELTQLVSKYKDSDTSNDMLAQLYEAELDVVRDEIISLAASVSAQSAPLFYSLHETKKHYIILKTLSSFTNTLNPVSKRTSRHVSLSILSEMLLLVSLRIEYDPDFDHVSYKPLTRSLSSSIELSVKKLKSENYLSIDFDFIYYMQAYYSHINTGSLSNRDGALIQLVKTNILLNGCCLLTDQIKKLSLPYEASESIKAQLETLEETLHELEPVLRERIDQLRKIAQKSQTVEHLELSFTSISDLYEKLLHTCTKLEEESSFIQSEVDPEILMECFGGDESSINTWFEENFKSLSEMKEFILQVRFITVDGVIFFRVTDETIPKETLAEINVESERLTEVNEQLLSWASKFRDKERLIEELSLKLRLLEESLVNSESKNERLITLEHELQNIVYEKETLSDLFVHLQADYTSLEMTMKDAMSRRKLNGNFDNIYEEKEANSKSSLISEIHLLRNLVKKCGSLDDYFKELEWLNEPMGSTMSITTPLLNEFKHYTAESRKLINKARIIPLSSQGGNITWKPQELTPRYYVSMLKDSLGVVDQIKRSLIE